MKNYLSVRQICQLLPVCKSLIYRLIGDGTIPSARVGGRILVPEDGLQALLEPRKAQADSVNEADPVVETPPKNRRRQRKRGKVELW